jgi:hypothetical protein
MVLIFVIIFGIQYKIAMDEGEIRIGQIIENTLLWSVISYIVIGIILLGISILVTSES